MSQLRGIRRQTMNEQVREILHKYALRIGQLVISNRQHNLDDMEKEWIEKYNYEWVSADDWRRRQKRLRVKLDNFIGVVSYENRILLPIEYNTIQVVGSYYYCQRNRAVYIFKYTPDTDTKFTLLNTLPVIEYNNENLIVRVEDYFSDSFYRIIKQNCGSGFCDKKGTITVPPHFKFAKKSKKYQWVFATTDADENFYLINRNGLISPFVKNNEIIINSGFHKGCRGRVIDITIHKEYCDYHDETYIDYQLTIRLKSHSIRLKIGEVDIIPVAYETINEYIQHRSGAVQKQED